MNTLAEFKAAVEPVLTVLDNAVNSDYPETEVFDVKDALKTVPTYEGPQQEAVTEGLKELNATFMAVVDAREDVETYQGRRDEEPSDSDEYSHYEGERDYAQQEVGFQRNEFSTQLFNYRALLEGEE
jgi:hypothetical protein